MQLGLVMVRRSVLCVYKTTAIFIVSMNITRYTHAHQVPHVEHIESSKWRSSKRWRDDAMLSSAYPFTSQRAGGDAQVFSRHRYLVFGPFVEQLTVFHTYGLVLASFSIF